MINTNIKALLLALFGIFIVIHTLYAPRYAERSFENQRSRAFIFDEDFNRVDITVYEAPDSLSIRGETKRESYNEAVLDWERYILIIALGFGVYLISSGLLNLKKSS